MIIPLGLGGRYAREMTIDPGFKPRTSEKIKWLSKGSHSGNAQGPPLSSVKRDRRPPADDG